MCVSPFFSRHVLSNFHVVCVTIYSCIRDKNINFHVVHIAQTKCSIKYISNIYGCVMQVRKNY